MMEWTFKEEMIEKLRLIEDGWDWRGGKKPSEKAIAGAAEVVDLFDEEQIKKCAVFPSCDGGVYVQYRDGDARVMVFVGEDGKKIWLLKRGDEKKVGIWSVEEMKETLLEFLAG